MMKYDFSFDLAGRVRNINLPPSPANSLIPLFEAISNSLHAIEDAFGISKISQGRILIELERDQDGNPLNFCIKDNGVGLTEKNMKSFMTSDSQYKRERGGKGVGRLSWLKAYEDINVSSVYKAKGGNKKREFLFTLKRKKPITVKIDSEPTDEPIGTSVFLNGLNNEYRAKCPKRAHTILEKVVGHFLPYFSTPEAPKLSLQDEEDLFPVEDILKEALIKSTEETVSVALDEDTEISLEIRHGTFKKGLSLAGEGHNFLFFVADNRVVEHIRIDNQLGLKTHGDGYIYIGVISSKFFNDRTNQERTALDISDEEMSAIRSAVDTRVFAYLDDEIREVRSEQESRVISLINENPQFLLFKNKVGDFVKENLALNKKSSEDIYLELSRHKRRRRKRTLKTYVEAKRKGDAKNVERAFNRLVENIQDEKKSSLAEYIVRRKAILEIFDNRRGFLDDESESYWYENKLHELICPLRSSSDDLTYEDHDLWIIDDRLSFFSYFASDKSFKSIDQTLDSGKEPDLVFFNTNLAFRRTESDDHIVIIEFKRPGRNVYDAKENPVSQILGYIDILRNSSKDAKDKSGKILDQISNNTRFTGYIVADLTSKLKTVLDGYDFKETADGNGRFKIHERYNAFIEVIPYSKLIEDAKMRNAIFFEKLGLSDT